ncbi:Crp/Fnr family transcriptional regulator [Flavobacterium shii]|nr:Crp/Fnr family transcriptional regulator [Flavobacterium shii]
MSTVEPLIKYFEKLIPLSQDEKALVNEKFQMRLYRKKQYALQEGDICSHLHFIVRGCLRMYKIDPKGNTHILDFAAENWWISDIGSYHSVLPSEMNIDAIEDTMVFQISYKNLITLYTQAPKFNLIFRVLIENSYVALQKRLLQNISSTAEERYNYFLETYPHLINRLPQTQIAAFVGITPEFVSRLRNRRIKP